MSDFDPQELTKDVQNQTGRIAKAAGRKALKRLAKSASKAVAKALSHLIKVILQFVVKAVGTLLGWEGILIVLAVLAFAAFISAIPFGDWILGKNKTSESDMLISAQYQETFVSLSEQSTLPIDNEVASDEWKTTLKSIVQPSWAIPASIARYEMIRSTGKVKLPDAEKMFEGLEPTYTYTTISEDIEYTKVVKVCYVEKNVKDAAGNDVLDADGNPVTEKVGKDPDESTTSKKMPSKEILASVTIPFGSTQINSVVKYYPGGTLTDEKKWDKTGSHHNDDTDCDVTTYKRSVQTVVDDRGVPFTDFDADAFKSYIISKGVKEQHLDEFFEYVLAADPDFPVELYSGVIGAGVDGFVSSTGNYAISGEMIDGWVWPIANTPMNVNSFFGARWGKNHNGVDLGGRAYKNAPILAARDGVVIYSGWSDSYGNWAIISHDNNLQTRYAHMTSYTVRAGDEVSAGDQIGIQGTTGRSTGPHLHFEVIQPDPDNPLGRTSNAPKIYDPMIFLGPIKESGG